MTPPEPDELLMAQVAKGRGESLEPLVRRYTVPLVSFLHRMTGKYDRAEDLFQETFLAVWRKRATYQFPRPFKPWVYAVALNTCRAEFRGREDFEMLPTDVAVSDPSDPVEKSIATETSTRIAKVIELMPPIQRAVVAMRIWDGLGYPEIAEAIGRSEATVRSHMSHGLAELRKALA